MRKSCSSIDMTYLTLLLDLEKSTLSPMILTATMINGINYFIYIVETTTFKKFMIYIFNIIVTV